MVTLQHLDVKAKGEILLKSGRIIPAYSLYNHLYDVSIISELFAKYHGYNGELFKIIGILHDIGKASPIFQERLSPNFKWSDKTEDFRHEIASLFFISLFEEKDQIINGIIAHHKSIYLDAKGKGIIDLVLEYTVDDVFEKHIKNWDEWVEIALDILESLGIQRKKITYEDAKNNFHYVVDYCDKLTSKKTKEYGFTYEKGILMGSDHFASALLEETKNRKDFLFKKPNLSFYHNRKSDKELYPLAFVDTANNKKHSIVVAPTGAGKTDFLFKRCKGRVFYTLPFTASINAMYHRVLDEIGNENPDADKIVTLQHSSSKLQVQDREQKIIQNLIGSAIKILTPHQFASIAFGTYGYESVILDLAGCDVILDEIHTYSNNIQGIVLKIIEVLNNIGCRIHIGTATMPTLLYEKILKILGDANTYEVKLSENELDRFNRHIIHKISNYESIELISDSIKKGEKVLLVCNRVKNSQTLYGELKELFGEEIPILLLHSRFRRKDRNRKEKLLMELNDSTGPCIVISTQVVEVSLNISFDMMISESAPIDALVQRFGRINRKRNKNTIGIYKNIYVIEPPTDSKDVLPYNLKIVDKSWDVLPNGELLEEKNIQNLIDQVYSDIEINLIENSSIFRNNQYVIKKLIHNSKDSLIEEFKITTANVILDSDVEEYKSSNYEQKTNLEIPVNFFSIDKLDLDKIENDNRYIVSQLAYSYELGLDVKSENIIPNMYEFL